MPPRSPRPNDPDAPRSHEAMSASRRERKAQIRSLPTSLKVVRIAELAFFPVVAFTLLAIPVPRTAGEVIQTVLQAAEAVAAVAVVVGLGQRRRWAWPLAVVLAGWVIAQTVAHGGQILASVLGSPNVSIRLTVPLLLAWTLLTQLFALVGCLLTRDWREELR